MKEESSFKKVFDDAKQKVEDAFNRAPEDLKEAMADMMENLGNLMGDIRENLNKNAEHLKKSAKKEEPDTGVAEEPQAESGEEPRDKEGFESFQESFTKAAKEFKDVVEEELGHIAERMDELTDKLRKYRSEKKGGKPDDGKEQPQQPDPEDLV